MGSRGQRHSWGSKKDPGSQSCRSGGRKDTGARRQRASGKTKHQQHLMKLPSMESGETEAIAVGNKGVSKARGKMSEGGMMAGAGCGILLLHARGGGCWHQPGYQRKHNILAQPGSWEIKPGPSTSRNNGPAVHTGEDKKHGTNRLETQTFSFFLLHPILVHNRLDLWRIKWLGVKAQLLETGIAPRPRPAESEPRS